MPYLHPSVLDSGLQVLTSDATAIHLCTTEPATYAAALTASVGVSSTFTVSAPQDIGTGGRKVTVAGIGSGTMTGTGVATHYAIVDGNSSTLLAARSLSPAQGASVGNPWQMGDLTIAMPSYQPPPSQDPGLIYSTDLSVLGSFRVPNTLRYYDGLGGGAAYNAANNSLFTRVGNEVLGQRVLELSIPTLQASGTISGLAESSTLQADISVPPLMSSWPLVDRLGDLHVYDSTLLGSAFVFYDASGSATVSHYRLDSLTLSSTTGTGAFRVGATINPGYTGGYMCDIPAAYQASFGGPVLTGLSTVSIASRTSNGPSAWVWDPADISGTSTVNATPLCYYPLATPLGGDLYADNDLFNWVSVVTGVVWPVGSRAVLFFGRHGLGGTCYGTGEECSDPTDPYKGWHDIGGNYRHYVWAYDSDDLLDVKTGTVDPWSVQPYAYWNLDLPFQVGSRRTGGVAYDSATNKIYLMAQSVDYEDGRESCPLIHVLQVS